MSDKSRDEKKAALVIFKMMTSLMSEDDMIRRVEEGIQKYKDTKDPKDRPILDLVMLADKWAINETNPDKIVREADDLVDFAEFRKAMDNVTKPKEDEDNKS